jgi:hypothetical protein
MAGYKACQHSFHEIHVIFQVLQVQTGWYSLSVQSVGQNTPHAHFLCDDALKRFGPPNTLGGKVLIFAILYAP